MEPIPAWHGSITRLRGERITDMLSPGRGPRRPRRMYLGFSDGTIGWFTLPCVPDPASV